MWEELCVCVVYENIQGKPREATQSLLMEMIEFYYINSMFFCSQAPKEGNLSPESSFSYNNTISYVCSLSLIVKWVQAYYHIDTEIVISTRVPSSLRCMWCILLLLLRHCYRLSTFHLHMLRLFCSYIIYLIICIWQDVFMSLNRCVFYFL